MGRDERERGRTREKKRERVKKSTKESHAESEKSRKVWSAGYGQQKNARSSIR